MKYEDKQAFAALLNKHLQKVERPAKWLAGQIKVHVSTVTRWCRAETLPRSQAIIEAIVHALDIPPDERRALLRFAGFPDALPSAGAAPADPPASNASGPANEGAPKTPTTTPPVTATAPPTTPKVVNIYGPVQQFINEVNNSVIYAGDPPEVQQQKAAQRATFIAGEVTYYIENIDARLGLVINALISDSFTQKLADVRRTVAPALEAGASLAYQKLIANQQISALRHQFNNYPLVNEPSPVLLQLAAESQIDETQLRFFYSQLGEVQWACETMFEKLAGTPSRAGADELAYYQRSVDLAVATLHNRAAQAHIRGLWLLHVLSQTYPDAAAGLAQVSYLEPCQRLDAEAIGERMVKLAVEMGDLTQQRAGLMAEGERLRDAALADYAAVADQLIIQPGDTWNLVSAKAISLRQLGRIDQAIAVFQQYGEMFAASDPTAAAYAHTAQHFTLQMGLFQVVDGALYIYAVEEGSVAEHNGLLAGDILIELNGQPIRNQEDFASALAQMTLSAPVSFIYLRLGESGLFQRRTITCIAPRPLGISLMPI